jgi:large subunit ribosomal protein L4
MSTTFKISIVAMDGKTVGKLEALPQWLVDGHKGEQAVHDVVVALLANRRRGTASTLTIGGVHGSGKKPWRQKGTGRARAGSFASPLWRGGGVVFGPKPRDWSLRLPRKVKHLALRRALSDRLRAGGVVVINDLKLPTHKTKELVECLKKLGLASSVLILASPADNNLRFASRNLPGIEVSNPESLNAYDVLRFEKLLCTQAAFEKLSARLTTVK